ncbi:hypothetical protein ACFQZE_23950 [Paenibacillus sp. GCM10027627]|uniref:hypothetical protein n=1 Tax=unclassified Paenibacillus TaxID=185978 RepID=UPI003644DA6C
MEQLVTGMQSTIAELMTWQGANPDVPDAVKNAIRIYRGEMLEAIKTMKKARFEEGDLVELTSSKYENGEEFWTDVDSVYHE